MADLGQKNRRIIGLQRCPWAGIGRVRVSLRHPTSPSSIAVSFPYDPGPQTCGGRADLSRIHDRFRRVRFLVLVGAAIGLLSLRVGLLRTHAAWQVLLGIYLLFLALTYAVLLGLAIAAARRGDAREEVAGELRDLPATFRKYRRESLWILVPLVVPLAALRER